MKSNASRLPVELESGVLHGHSPSVTYKGPLIGVELLEGTLDSGDCATAGSDGIPEQIIFCLGSLLLIGLSPSRLLASPTQNDVL